MTPRRPELAGIVTLDAFMRYLRQHRRDWPVARIVQVSGLPRTSVYEALSGRNAKRKTLEGIAKAFGGDLCVAIRKDANKVEVSP